MFSSIAFYIGDKVLGLNGQEYPLGELTAEVLNISPEEYHELQRIMGSAMDGMARYEDTHQMQDWFNANEEMICLHNALSRHRIFRLLREDEEILSEARTLTEQYSLFTGEEAFVVGERDEEILHAIEEYQSYLEHPEEYGGTEQFSLRFGDERFVEDIPKPPVPPESPEKTRALLIVPGSLAMKWTYYTTYCMNYGQVLTDIASVCQTLRAFIRMGLSHLKELTPDNYVAALHTFLFHERSYKWIANPVEGTGFYTLSGLVQAVHAIVDGDEAHTVAGEDEFGVLTHLKVLTAQPGHVLHDEGFHMTVFHHLHDLLPAGAVEVGPGVAIVIQE